MKSIKNFEKISNSNLQKINGGGNGDGTTYTTSTGNSGTDCYSDDDDSGDLSSGDGVLLDTGQWITKK